MPRVAPAGAAAAIGSSSGFAPALLVDLQLLDGTILYLCDRDGIYPMRIGAGGNVAYKPWLKSVAQFHVYKSLRTDAGAITLQNLSGNTIQREVLQQLNASEFEGALLIFRAWHVALEWAMWEFHGKVSAPQGGEVDMTLQALQLFDMSSTDAPIDTYSEQCPVQYKGQRCGSASGLATCAKTFGDCTVRGVPERFAGISNPPPQDLQMPIGQGSQSNDGPPQRRPGMPAGY